TRYAVATASIVTVGFALFFTSMVSAWVFMASILVSAALVPTVAALFLERPPRPLAGLLSSSAGLAVAALVFVLTTSLGAWDADRGTSFWSVTLNVRTLEIWW